MAWRVLRIINSCKLSCAHLYHMCLYLGTIVTRSECMCVKKDGIQGGRVSTLAAVPGARDQKDLAREETASA